MNGTLVRSIVVILVGVFLTRPLEGAMVTEKVFGKNSKGEKVVLYTLSNAKGSKVCVMNYGATIVQIVVPDRTGKLADVALGFDDFEPYMTKSPYFGATVGRYANRIAHGRFSLDGKDYQLACNNGANALHGGIKGFDKQIWTAEILKSDEATVRFSLVSKDGEEGYPGNFKVSVTFTFNDENELAIRYEATTDKTTIVNLTNHSYFNLAGAGNGSVLGHEVKIHSDEYTPVDASLIPTGKLVTVENTPMDFRTETAIGKRIKEVGGKPVGYDHNYVLNKGLLSDQATAAEVYEPKSGRTLKVLTDQPGIQFYTGNFLDGSFAGKGGAVYQQYAGFCLETQHYPDSPNQPNFPSVVLKPGETFKTSTTYVFGVR